MKKLVGRAVLPLLGLSLLAGCTPTGGTAAIVNGVTIPDSRVTEFAKGCSVALENAGESVPPSLIRPDMVRWVVLGEVGRQYVEAGGAGPTEEQLRTEIRRNGVDNLLSDARCEQGILGLMRYALIEYSLGQQGAETTLHQYSIELNPRYGRWDWSQTNGVGSGSLSQESPTNP